MAPGWVPPVVAVVVIGVAGFGAMMVLVVGNPMVDDDCLYCATWAQILLSTVFSNIIYWSSLLEV